MNIIRTLGIVVLLAGCASTAHLYPANDFAVRTGVLEAHYTAWGTGHTQIDIKMPDVSKCMAKQR